MDYREIKVKGRVSEALPEVVPILEQGGDIMMKAPTGAGKTYAMLQLRELLPYKKIAFLCPTRALVDNIEKDYEGPVCGYASQWLHDIKTKGANYTVSTYDSINGMMEWDNPPELVIIDEAHLVVGHAEFREVTADLLRADVQKIFLSATPEIIEGWPGLQLIEIKAPGEDKRVSIARLGKRNPVSLIQDIIKGRRADSDHEQLQQDRRLLMIRFNNKEKLKEVHYNLPDELRKITAIYYSERQELHEIFPDGPTSKLEKGVIPYWIEILLVTSIYDAGLSLEVSREVDCFAISSSNKRMPHPIDMAQLQNRVRVTDHQEAMSLTIIGNYGRFELDDIEGMPTSKKPEMWLKIRPYRVGHI